MEHLSIKPNGNTDDANSIQTGSRQGSALAGLATNFKELVSKAGIHIDYRLNLFAERSGIAAIGETVNPTQHDDGHRPDTVRNDQDSANSIDRSARDNYYSADHSSAEPVERDDDSSRNQSNASHGDRDGSSMKDQADSDDTGSSERHASDDSGSGDQENSREMVTSDGAEPTDDKGNDGQSQGETQSASSNDGNQDGQTVTAGTDGANAASLVAGGRVNTMNADTMTGGNANPDAAAGGRVNAMNADAMIGGNVNPVTATEGRVSSMNADTIIGSNANPAAASGGPVNAINSDANIGGNTKVAGGLVNAMNANSAASEADKVNAESRLGRAAVVMDAGDETKFDGLAGAAGKRESVHTSQGTRNIGSQQGQVHANPAAEQAQAQAKTIPTSATATQQQAAELTKIIGSGDRVLVDVNVTRDADAITSKPISSLTMNTILADAGKGQSQSNQHSSTAQNASGQSAHMAAAGQTQAQAAQQSAQNQATLQAATDARGPANVNAAANSAGNTTHAGGGEGAAPTAGTGGSQQAQQSTQAQANNAQAQANNTNKPVLPGHSVVDQVSIKITKALQAGNDRITVQLRPADLGRVEVKMELTHDGRVMAVVTADNKDTLDLLRRDSAELQKSLQNAGMDLDSGDLTFNLRGQEGETAEGNESNAGMPADDEVAGDGTDDTAVDETVATDNIGVLVDGHIDVRA